DVQTFSTDSAVQMRLKDKTVLRELVRPVGVPATQPATAPAEVQVDGRTVPVGDIKRVQAKQAWAGSVVANGNLARGNTHAEDFGLAADAVLRRDDEFHDDRFSLAAAYNFGNQTVGGVHTTSADNWFAQVKYDRFFTEQW